MLQLLLLLQAVVPQDRVVVEVQKMTYTAAEILLFIAAVGAIITTSIQSWRSGSTIQSIKETSKVIEGHVNSQTTQYKEEIRALQEQRTTLQTTIVELRETAKLLAQAAVRPPVDPIEVKITDQPVQVVPTERIT